jgi:RNA polymerase sigma factor (sigma-70 family)
MLLKSPSCAPIKICIATISIALSRPGCFPLPHIIVSINLGAKKLPTFSLHDDEGTPREYIPDTSAIHPEKALLYNDQSAEMQELLQSLSEIDRAAIILRYWHEASEVEIAESLNISVSAVKSRLFRARRQLGEVWQAESEKTSLGERMPYGSPAY